MSDARTRGGGRTQGLDERRGHHRPAHRARVPRRRARASWSSTPTPVDPYLELAGVYRRVGAGTPVAPPTRIGPAMVFEHVKGFDMKVVAGVLASRLRTALLLGTTPDRLAFDLLAALERPVPPVSVPAAQAPCQEVVLRPPFDIRRLHPGAHQHGQGRRALPQHGPAARRGPRDRRIRRDHPPHVPHRPGHDDRELHRAVPPHRPVPRGLRAARQAAAGLRQHRLRPGHLPGHVVRAAHDAARLRRAGHRRRAARPPRRARRLRHAWPPRPSPAPRSCSRARSCPATACAKTCSPAPAGRCPSSPATWASPSRTCR